MKPLVLSIVTLFATLVPAGAAHPSTDGVWFWPSIEEWVMDTPLELARFGEAVAMSGDTILIAVPEEPNGGAGTGAAYVEVRQNGVWHTQAKLVPDDLAAGWKVWEVALDGDTAIVGAKKVFPLFQPEGAAYVFERTGTMWTQTAKLVPATGSHGFGEAYALCGDTLLASSYVPGVPLNTGRGSAHVFVRSVSTWSEEALLDLEGPGELPRQDGFGLSVDLDTDRALIGALAASEGPLVERGRAYVFERQGTDWSLTATLVPPYPIPNFDDFGRAVALDGDRALVGTRMYITSGVTHGGAVVYERVASNWVDTALLSRTGTDRTPWLGAAVDLHGDYAAIGAPGEGSFGPIGAGSVDIHRWTGSQWQAAGRAMAPDGSNANRFGQTLDLEGDLLVVGARDQEVGPIVTGRVYLCERTVFATANFRTDAAGINADAYEATPATPGQTWTATIDNTGTGNYMAAVVGYRHPLELFIPQASGYYLVNPTSPGGELLGLAPAFGYGLVTFEVPVPPNSAFLGLTLSTQGGSVGTGGVTLHNAYDLTIGL